jgi:hypothetical protein
MSSLYSGYGSIKDQLTSFLYYEEDEETTLTKKEHTKQELQEELEDILEQVRNYEQNCARQLGWR